MGNEVLNIIGSFHLEQDMDFLEACDGDVEDTQFLEDTSLATRALDNLSTFVKPTQLADPLIIPISEVVAIPKLADTSMETFHPLK